MWLNKLSKLAHFSYNTKRFYQILGISVQATSDQIKSAYYQKAKAHHPDLNPHETGNKFNQIRNAYEEIMKIGPTTAQSQQSKPKSKSYEHSYNTAYNTQQNDNAYQKTKYKKKNNFKHSNHQKNYQEYYQDLNEEQNQDLDFNQTQFRQFEKAFNSYLRNGYLKQKYMKFKPYIDKIFSDSMGFMYDDFDFEQKQAKNGNHKKQSKRNKTYKQQEQQDQEEFRNIKTKHKLKRLDILYQLQLKQEQVGKTIKIKFDRQINCNKCQFNPQQNFTKVVCKSCQKGQNSLTGKCSNCKGKGYTKKYDCKTCKNKGFLLKKVQEVIMIPLGLQQGEILVLEGRGHQHRKKGTFGDLVINIHYQGNKQNTSNSKKAKHENSKEIQIEINIFQAIFGGVTIVKTSKGHLNIKIPSGTQDGDIIKNTSSKQTKRIKVNIQIPSHLTNEQKLIYEKLRNIEQNK